VCTLVVSLLQYIVLSVLYEASGPLDAEAITALTRIERGQLQHVLEAFQTVGLVHEDAFRSYLLSSTLSSTDDVIVLSEASAKSAQSEPLRKASSEKSLDYGPLIQAALMRYMKRSQETPLSTLQADVLAELSARFLPNHEELEKALNSLVDREFLRRDPKRRDIIHYVP
jgi:Fe2+ or Zn2+ uptake regulation protein